MQPKRRVNFALAGELKVPDEAGVSRDLLHYVIAAVLLVVFVALSCELYREHRLPENARFVLGPNGLSVITK
jgi:hypothetical protein